MNKHQTRPGENKQRESSIPSKETIKNNTEKENVKQLKKPTKSDRVERNYDKDQE